MKIASERKKIRDLLTPGKKIGVVIKSSIGTRKGHCHTLELLVRYVGLDELQVYGSFSENKNLALAQMDQRFTQIRYLFSRAIGSPSPVSLTGNLYSATGRLVTISQKNRTHG